MSEFNVAVGRRIRKLRESHGYTREKLAELAGMNDKFLYEVETGRKGLSAEKTFNLSRSLGVTMDFLVSGENNREEYRMITSLLSIFNEAEIKNIEDIIRKIIAISKPCQGSMQMNSPVYPSD